MAKLETIVKEPNPVLRSEARDIPLKHISSPEIKELLRAMKEALAHTHDGVGLAAPQVGKSLCIFIVSEEAEEIDRLQELQKKSGNLEKFTEEEKKEGRPKKRVWKYTVFINPTIKNISRAKDEAAEGCLSVPKVYGIVKRSQKITVEAYDEEGKKFIRGASRFFARVIQHELDHLKGTLFIDKVERFLKDNE